MSVSRIGMVDLAARHDAVAERVEARVLTALRSGHYVGGPLVAEAEALAAQLFGRSWAVGVNSGTDALILALHAAGLAPGDEVIVPALTFFATAGAVVAAGMVPVVVDVTDDALLDPYAAARARTPATRAVIPVHLYGASAPAPELDLRVIDDLAQVAGAENSPRTGILGAVSTYPTKTWGGAGDGGFVVGDDPELHERIRRLGAHGAIGPHLHALTAGHVGRNSRLDALQAAILVAHAPSLPDRVARRRHHAAHYDAALPEGVRPLPRGPDHPVHQYVVRVRDRARVVEHLDARGIDCGIYYPRGLHRQPALAARARLTPCPVADRLAEELLALPVHAHLTEPEVDRVVAALREAR